MKVTPVTGLFGFVLGGFLLSLLLGAIEFVLKPKQDNSSKLEVRTQARILGTLYPRTSEHGNLRTLTSCPFHK